MNANTELATLLQNNFKRKQMQNPSYSMRALARDVGVTQPILSLYFRGKRRLTPSMAFAIGKYLKLDDKELLNVIVSTFEQ